MIRVAAGILFHEGRILACQRRGPGPFALKWEFPGGKIRPGETPEAALVRELEEELAIRVDPADLIPEETITHRYPGGPEVELHFFRVGRFAGRAANRAFADLAWVAPGELAALDFLDADRPLVARLAGGGVISARGSAPGAAREAGGKGGRLEIDPDQLDRRAAYHLMISVIVPRPIAWVTTVSAEGRRNLAPFSFFNGVSSQPPIVMIAVGGRKGEKKDTWRNVEQTGEFVVNVVTADVVDPMILSAKEFPPEVDEVEQAGLTALPSRRIRPPCIAESPVNLECRLEKLVEVGGTGLILGRVLLYHVRDDLIRNGRVDPARLNPVARLGGDSYSWLGELFERRRPD